MSEKEYRPSHLFLTDNPGEEPIYFDFIIAEKDGLVWSFAAWGDGAHINQVSVSGLSNSQHLMPTNIARHVGELEKFFREADSLIAVKDHQIVYKKVA